TMTYEYSPSGHLTAKVNGRNQRATYAYTAWGQQQSVIWNNAAADPVYYDYRDSGRLLAITDASGRRTITQRADGQYLAETVTAANAGH
ncbi:hypothetical protein, partial [Lactococcus petauri]|uniref:hypothetical protein n=1 Tax=Lactococcus petauri TaxID=1940789 RepID=UPI0021F0D599